ncbi:MAG: ATP-binding protein [Gammaproteobacteria bacterium]
MPVSRSLKRLLLTHEVAFIVLVVITGGVGGVWAWQWQQWSAATIRLNYLSHTALEIRSQLFRQIQEVSVAGLREDPRAQALNSRYARDTQELFNELRRKSAYRAEDYAVQAMQTAFSLLQANLRDTLEDPFALNRLVRAKLFDPAFEQRFVSDFERAFVSFQGLVDQQLAAQESEVKRWTELAPFGLAIPILIGFALLLFSRRSLTRGFVVPMQAVIAGTREVSGGNLRHTLPEAGVAEVRELARGINHMAQELEASRDAIVAAERQAALGALVPVVAHNIRNPLAAIRANAQLLDGSESAQERAEMREDIIETVDRLGRWVSALVSYLHPLQPQRRRVSASAVLDSALHLLEPRIAASDIVLVREPWASGATIDADADLLEQALYGLLNNAVEASPAGAELAVGVREADDRVILSIRDQAGGIPFEPEPTGLMPGPSTKRFGTGLGIPIAFKICATHGYRLEFHVAEGRGTEVVISAATSEEHQPTDGE